MSRSSFRQQIAKWWRQFTTGQPALTVGPIDRPYMYRWFALPWNTWFNVYLHQFLRDDDDRAMHNHPYITVSLILRGGYYDNHPGPDGTIERRWYGPGSIVLRGLRSRHRVELAVRKDGTKIPAWTLFLTGPRMQDWGFFCSDRFVPWRQFVEIGEHGEHLSGPGCDQQPQ